MTSVDSTLAMAYRVFVLAVLLRFLPPAQARDSEKDDPSCFTPSPSPLSTRHLPQFNTTITPTPQNTPKEWFFEGVPKDAYRLCARHPRQCPPWYDLSQKDSPWYEPFLGRYNGGATECKRDSAELAVMFNRPNNRCGPKGECMNAVCVTFNGLSFYPESSSAGFCIHAGTEMMSVAYIEKYILAVRRNHPWDFRNRWDQIMSTRWAQRDSPGILTCESFCTGGPTPNKGTIWSGDHGACKCHCVSGSGAGQFDRCTTVSEKVCTDSQYCGGHGKATWESGKDHVTSSGSATPDFMKGEKCSDRGKCSCACEGGWSGRNCELAPNTPCDVNDCNLFGFATGTRPNCKCTCSKHFYGDRCANWHWNHNKVECTVPARSSGFKISDDACVDEWDEGGDTCPAFVKNGFGCWRFGRVWPHNRRGKKKECAKSCMNKPSCKKGGGMDTERWWQFNSLPTIPGTHDKTKCREANKEGEIKLDEDCCAVPRDVSCADGYEVKFTGKKCGADNVPWAIIECLKPSGAPVKDPNVKNTKDAPSPPKDEKKNTKDAAKAKATRRRRRGKSAIPSKTCSFYPGKQWAPLDYGMEKKTKEGSATACSERCKKARGCIGSSFWRDGGCHLAGAGATLGPAKWGAVSHKCSAVKSSTSGRRRRRRRGSRRRGSRKRSAALLQTSLSQM